MDVQHQVAGSQTSYRKCDIQHCGADGRSGGRMYGQVGARVELRY